MLEKMDSLLAQVNGTVKPSGPACSDSPPLTAQQAQRIIEDAERRQSNWGTEYDREKHTGPTPTLDVIVRDMLPDLSVQPADADRLIRTAERIQHRADDCKRHAGQKRLTEIVGQRFVGATLESFVATTAEQKKVLAQMTDYSANIQSRATAGDGIILFGSAGTGKTHLLAAVAKTAIDAGLFIQWVNGQDLFATFRAAIDGQQTEAEIVREYRAADVLVVDDVLPPGGALTEYQASCLYRIIDGRYRDCRPTWASLNVADGAEAERGMGAQVVDRLRHGAVCLFCAWPSYRKGAING